MIPQSTMRISSLNSKSVIFLPIAPRPPRGIIFIALSFSMNKLYIPPLRLAFPKRIYLRPRMAEPSVVSLGFGQFIGYYETTAVTSAEYHLCDPHSAGDGKILFPEVGDYHLDLAAVIRINRPR